MGEPERASRGRRGRPPKPDAERYVPLNITMAPADLALLDDLVDAAARGMESRSSTIVTLIRKESRRRARRSTD